MSLRIICTRAIAFNLRNIKMFLLFTYIFQKVAPELSISQILFSAFALSDFYRNNQSFLPFPQTCLRIDTTNKIKYIG